MVSRTFICDICGMTVGSNVAMHNVEDNISTCMTCHHQYHQDRNRNIHHEIPQVHQSDIDIIKKFVSQGENTTVGEGEDNDISMGGYVDKRLAQINGDSTEQPVKQPIKYIPVSECIDGHLYRIRARNGRIGVFDKSDNNAFILSRHKFNSNFLYPEYHWDNGEPHGTVMPLEDLGELVLSVDEDLISLLNDLTNTVEGVEYPEFDK